MSEEKEVREQTLDPKREAQKTQLRESVRQAWRSGALRRCLEWSLRLALAAVLATGRVLENCSPFGLALVGACGPGAGGFAALLGAVGGYLLSRGLDEALRYAAASILVFAVSFAFYDLSIYRKGWFMPLSASLLNALTGFVTLQGQIRLRPASYLPALVAECALTALGVYAFRAASTLWRGRREEDGDGAAALGAQGAEATFRQQACLVLLAMAVLISLTDLTIAGTVSVGRLAAVWLVLWAGYSTGVGGGAAVGLCAGLAIDLASHGGQVYALAFAFSGLSGGIFRKNGRFVATLSFVTAGALAALWNWEQVDPVGMVAELAVGGGLFLAAPQRLLDRLNALFAKADAPSPALYAAQAAQRRLRDTANAFEQVFSALKGTFSTKTADIEDDPAVIYDRAASKVCASCPLRERCWQSQYQDTHDLLNAALGGLLEARTASPALLPQRFRDKCVRFPAFLGAINEELKTYLLRQQYDRQVGRSRRAVCRQYAQVAEALEDAAAAMAVSYTPDPLKTRRLSQFLAGRELRCEGAAFHDAQGRLHLQVTGEDAGAIACGAGVCALSSALDCPLALVAGATKDSPVTLLRQREPFSAIVGVYGQKKSGNDISGDACAWFKDDSGQLYLLLCDGMGTGREARKESETAIDLLEKFLKAGFSAENSLKMLDQAFCLRLEERGGFSTVDLLVFDLFSGRGTLYKLGSAPSYLKVGGTVKALRGNGFPAGLQEDVQSGKPSYFQVKLDPGDCLVLLTDGVLEGIRREERSVSEESGSVLEEKTETPEENWNTPEDDLWLRELLVGFDGGSPAALAEVIAGHGSPADDRTALVLRIALRDNSNLEFSDKAAV